MKQIIAIAVSTLVIYSCQVEEPIPPPQTSLRDTIAKTWTITEAKENGTTTADFNGNKITFDKNGTYLAISPFDTLSGTWEFNNSETHVIFDNNAKPAELLSDWEILELNNRRFRWKWVYQQENVEAVMEP